MAAFDGDTMVYVATMPAPKSGTKQAPSCQSSIAPSVLPLPSQTSSWGPPAELRIASTADACISATSYYPSYYHIGTNFPKDGWIQPCM